MLNCLYPNAIRIRPSGTWQQGMATRSFERNCGSGEKTEPKFLDNILLAQWKKR